MANDQTRTVDRPIVDAPNVASPKLSYRDLAWWAETADGTRGEDLVIADVTVNGSVRRMVKKKKDAQKNGDPIVVDDIRTESIVKDRPAVDRVTIEVGGQTIPCRSKDGVWCDAIFCSESAMEKFLFPYYHSQRLLTEGEWKKLKDAFHDRFTVAIGHVHPSHSFALGGGAAGTFYGLTAKPAKAGIEVQWENLIP
jgi:hypothetical protein